MIEKSPVFSEVVFKFASENGVATLRAEFTKDDEPVVVLPKKSHNKCLGRGFEGWKSSIDDKNMSNNGYPIPCKCLVNKVGALIGKKQFKYKMEVK